MKRLNLDYLGWFGFLACAVLVYVRLFYGVSVGDEAHYLSIARLPILGGEWFVQEKSIQQTPGMLLYPFLQLHEWMFGGEGIVLYVRHLHFVLSLITAFVVIRMLKLYTLTATAVLLGACVLAAVPFGLPSLSYNTQGSLFFGLATSLSVLAIHSGSRVQAALGGVTFVLSVFSYPTILAAFGPFSIAFLVLTWRKQRVLAWSLVLGCAVPAALLGAWLWAQGVDHILDAVAFSQVMNRPGDLSKIPYSLWLAAKFMPDLYLTGLFLAFWAFVVVKRRAWMPYAFFGFLCLYFVFGGRYESTPTQVLWVILLGLTSWFILPWGKRPAAVWLVIVPAFVGALAAMISSQLSLYSTCLTAIFGGLTLVALASAQSRVGILSASLVALLCLYYHYDLIYEDEKFSELTAEISSGPYRGLMTFPRKAEFLQAIHQAVNDPALQGKTILFKDLFPAGYLMQSRRPAGFTMYFAPIFLYPAARHQYVNRFNDSRDWPEVVVELAFYPQSLNQNYPYLIPNQMTDQDPFRDFFLNSGRYSVVRQMPTHRILSLVR